MVAQWILAGMAAIFLGAAVASIIASRGKISLSARTWLTIGIIFALVSGYLWMSG
jgi:hypothetical protein